MHSKFNNLQNTLLVFLFVMIFASACGPAISDDRALNGDTLHEVWKQDVGSPVNHPPLRLGNVLIVAPDRKPLLGLEVESGKILWSYDPGVRVWDRAYASDGERLFVGIEGGKFVALDPFNGKLLWETELGINTQIPPFVSNDIIYVSTTFAGAGLVGDPSGKAKLFAISPKDGHILWEFESDNYVLQSSFRKGDVIYVSGSYYNSKKLPEGGYMRLYALNAADGSELWHFESEDGFTKQLYATNKTVAYIAYQDFTVGVDGVTGKEIWRKDAGNWVPTLSGTGDTIYYGSANTMVHSVDVNSGRTLWTFDIPEGTFNYVLGAPVRTAGDLVFLTQLGDFIALDATSGVMRWRIPTGLIGARIGLTVSGGWLFFGDADGFMHGYFDR